MKKGSALTGKKLSQNIGKQGEKIIWSGQKKLYIF